MSTPPDSTNGEKKSSATTDGEAKQKTETKRGRSESRHSSKDKDGGQSFDTAIPVLSAYGYALGDTLGKGKTFDFSSVQRCVVCFKRARISDIFASFCILAYLECLSFLHRQFKRRHVIS